MIITSTRTLLIICLMSSAVMPMLGATITPENPTTYWQSFKDYYGPEIAAFAIPAGVVTALLHYDAKPERVKQDLEDAKIIDDNWERDHQYPYTFQEVRQAKETLKYSESELIKKRNKAKWLAGLGVGAIALFHFLLFKHADHTHVGVNIGGGSSYGGPASSAWIGRY